MFSNKREQVGNTLGQGKIYKTMSTIAYLGLFVAFGIIVLSIMGTLPVMDAVLWGIVASIAIIGLSIISMLPWIRRIESNKFTKISRLFTIFIGICAVLWLICLWMVIVMIKSEDPSSMLWFLVILKITVILSLQLTMATFIGSVAIKCGKTMIVVQAIAYLSFLFVDFYLSFLAGCVIIRPKDATNPVGLSDAIHLLGNSTMVTLFVLSLVYCIISGVIMRAVENRKTKAITEDFASLENTQNDIFGQTSTPIKSETAEEKLEKLKYLHDRKLITEEEYTQKRNDILSKL